MHSKTETSQFFVEPVLSNCHFHYINEKTNDILKSSLLFIFTITWLILKIFFKSSFQQKWKSITN